MSKLKVRVATLATLMVAAAAVVFTQAFQYPVARKVDQVDTYHGTKVADPYRWLEDDNSPETAAWIEAENKVTFPYLERIPYRQQFQDRVKRLNDYAKYSAPSHKGPYFFFTKNDGLQNQSVLYIQQGFDGHARGADRSERVVAGRHRPTGRRSPLESDAKHAAYAVSRSGSDWQELHVMELATKKIARRQGRVGEGVGHRLARPAGSTTAAIPRPPRARSSRRSTRTTRCTTIASARSSPTTSWSTRTRAIRSDSTPSSTTEDERFAVLSISERGKGKDGNGAVRAGPVARTARTFSPLIPTIGDDSYDVIDNVGDKLLVETNSSAPNWPRRADRSQAARRSQLEDRVAGAARTDRQRRGRPAGQSVRHLSEGRRDPRVRLQPRRQAGERDRAAGPGHARADSAASTTTRSCSTTFKSLNVPPSIYRYDIATRKSACSAKPRSPATTPRSTRPSRCSSRARTARECRCSSCTARGSTLDGNNPTLLYGYGGFNIVQRRRFNAAAARAARAGIRLRVGEPARRRRVRRDLAPGGHEAEEAERVRRLHRRGRVADCQQVHVAGAAGDPGRIERRSAGRAP